MKNARKKRTAIKSGPVSVDPADQWDNVTVTLQYGWLNAGELLKTPSGGLGTFKLEPYQEPDIVGEAIKRLRVTFKDGEMLQNWSNTVFDTCGISPPKVSEDLPEWADNAATKREYRRILHDVISELRVEKCDLERIEGTFVQIEKFPNKVLRREHVFRGVFLQKVVRSAAGPNTDLVLLIASDPQGGPAPDGGATGPPKPP
jgi:hypothetical protein